MKLTFPIDTCDPRDLPVFSMMYKAFDGSDAEFDCLLRYLCYRYDPRFQPTTSDREAEAKQLSGFSGPGDPPVVTDKGDLMVPPEFQKFMDMITMFFAILNKNDWQEICSLEFMIVEAHEIMMTPIPKDAAAAIKMDHANLKFRLSEGCAKQSARLKVLYEAMADGSSDAKAALEATATTRKIRDITGRVKQ